MICSFETSDEDVEVVVASLESMSLQGLRRLWERRWGMAASAAVQTYVAVPDCLAASGRSVGWAGRGDQGATPP